MNMSKRVLAQKSENLKSRSASFKIEHHRTEMYVAERRFSQITVSVNRQKICSNFTSIWIHKVLLLKYACTGLPHSNSISMRK